jgi:hypothetical protein
MDEDTTSLIRACIIGLLTCGAAGCSLPAGDKASCAATSDCNATSECSHGQCVRKASLEPTALPLSAALSALCDAHEGALAPQTTGNANYLESIGQWVLCKGSLGIANAQGVQFGADGHINLMIETDAGTLAPEVGFAYEGNWTWTSDADLGLAPSSPAGNLVFGGRSYETNPRRIHVQTYLPNSMTAMPITLAYVGALPTPACAGADGKLSDVMETSTGILIDDGGAGADHGVSFYFPYAVGRYQLCSGPSIVAPTTAQPAGFELAEDGSAFTLIDDGHGNLMRGESLGTWLMDGLPKPTDMSVAMPRLTFTRAGAPTLQFFPTVLEKPNGLSFTTGAGTSSYRVIP